MDIILFSWTDLLKGGFALFIIYFSLRFLERRIRYMGRKHPIWERIDIIGQKLLTIYEPLAILLLFCIFLFINPIFHGTIFLLALIIAFPSIRNYMYGRLIHLDENILVGKRINVKGTNGVIVRIKNMGLLLQTNEGLEYINYSNLLKEGYTILSGKEIGGLYQLRFVPENKENNLKTTSTKSINHIEHLMDLLSMTPYLNFSHLPYLTRVGKTKTIEGKIMLNQEKHLPDLLQLIEEWGYDCEVIEG